MKNNTEHIFFDLDRTLWDFERNSRETIQEIFTQFNLQNLGIESFEEFHRIYLKYNEICWQLYRENKINKVYLRRERFRKALAHFQLKNNKLAKDIGDYYVEHSPIKTHLVPGSIEVLEHLQSKYILHLVTNGFEEVQWIKIKNSGLQPFFKEIITSEKAGVKKPDPKIFDFALKLTKAKRQNTVMIGDDIGADIKGAKASGIYSVWFNRDGLHTTKDPNIVADWEIRQLLDLKSRF